MKFGATILDAEGLRLTGEEKAFFRDANPFGFILFARNIDSADQVRALCADFREAVGREAPITIDQEGGRVQRIWAPMVRDWLPPLDFVEQAGAHAPRAMYLRYRLIAEELRGLGIDSNCAPMGDLARSETHAFLRNRCYGAEVAPVVATARACADGLLDGGVLPVVKHIPGHGRAHLDTHFDLPRVTTDADTLRASDFAVFRDLNDLPMGMTAHLVFDAFDDRPSTISPVMMQLIRDEIGFDGLIMTDDIDMQALSGTVDERAASAIAAGCDAVLHCNGTLADRQAVAAAIGEMSEAGQRRAEAVLAARRQPVPVDIEALAEELKAF